MSEHKDPEPKDTQGEPKEPETSESKKEGARKKAREGQINSLVVKALKDPSVLESEKDTNLVEEAKKILSKKPDETAEKLKELEDFKNNTIKEKAVEEMIGKFGWDENEFSESFPDFNGKLSEYMKEYDVEKAIKLAKSDIVESGFSPRRNVVALPKAGGNGGDSKLKKISISEFDKMDSKAKREYMKESVDAFGQVKFK